MTNAAVLTSYERNMLKSLAGFAPPRPWGAAVGAVLEYLRGHGYITPSHHLTDKGLVEVAFIMNEERQKRLRAAYTAGKIERVKWIKFWRSNNGGQFIIERREDSHSPPSEIIIYQTDPEAKDHINLAVTAAIITEWEKQNDS